MPLDEPWAWADDVVLVPFAGEVTEVRRAQVRGRPVFDAAVAVAAGRSWGRIPEAVAPWPSAPVSPDAAQARVGAAWAPDRLGEPVEGFVIDGDVVVPVLRVPMILAGAVWAVDVDAASGGIVRTTRTSREARGRVYDGSPFTGSIVTTALPGVDGAALDGPYARSRSCEVSEADGALFSLTACDHFGRHAEADGRGDFFFFPTPASPVDPFAEVHLYWHADFFSRWLDRRFGLRFWYAPVWANANFGLTNAFFGDFDLDGVPEVSFGTDVATGTDYAYDADVVYHELGHAVVGEWAAALPFLAGDEVGMSWVGGAVNEGAADVFAMIHNPDPLVGEYAGSSSGDTAIRDLTHLRRCPDDLIGEVHADGELFASLGWALVSDPAVGSDLTAEMLAGVLPRLGADVDWPAVGRAFHEAADEAHAAGVADDAARDAILGHLEASGLEGCGRVIPLDDGRTVPQLLVNGGLLGPLARLPGGVGFSVDVVDGATAVVVEASDFRGPEGMGLAVYGRWGEPVGHDFVSVESLGVGFATPATWDFVVDGDSDLVVDVDDLRPGQTLYLSLASVNLGGLEPLAFQYAAVSLRAEVTVSEPALAEPRGCHTGPAAPALAGVAGLLALRRRVSRGARAR